MAHSDVLGAVAGCMCEKLAVQFAMILRAAQSPEAGNAMETRRQFGHTDGIPTRFLDDKGLTTSCRKSFSRLKYRRWELNPH